MKSIKFNDSFNKVSGEKRKKILDTAVMEFSEYGFDRANINNIAKNSGISVGSVYKYFDNKEDMFLKVIQYCVETLKTVLKEIMDSDDNLETRVGKIIKAIQFHSRSNVQLTKLYNEMASENHSSLVWKIVSDIENTTAEIYVGFIKDAQKSGIVRPDVNPNLFAFFLDNLFVLLQFSYACEYYKERLKIYVGDAFDNDELVYEQLMKFIKGAFFLK